MPEPIKGVYERKPDSGIWWIRYTDSTGKQRKELAGTRSNAQTLLAKRKTEVLQRKKLPELGRNNLKFDVLCADALEYSQDHHDPKVTYDFNLKIQRILPDFGTHTVESITKQHIDRWLSGQATEHEWKASTRNRWQAAFSLIFRLGIEHEKIERNPAAGIRRIKENNARTRYLSDKEEVTLRSVILKRFPAFIHQLDLSLYTGMRAGEQFSLRWSQIDFKRRILTLPKTKNGTVRHIPLNATAIAALSGLKISPAPNPDDLVFPSARQETGLKSARGWFVSALEDANIKGYTWHCNRHTFASRLAMAGVDIRTIGELLGHKSLAMTMRYSHLAPEHNKAAVDLIARR